MASEFAGRDLSSILVVSGEDQKVVDHVTNRRRELVAQLQLLGAAANRIGTMAVDVAWAAAGRPCMWDLKTPEDFMASAQDGRLHYQMEAMRKADPLLFGFVIEGSWGADGVVIGYGPHAWSWERFDNLVLSVQCEGAKIIHSSSPTNSARRLFSLYQWTGKTETGSWHAPSKPAPVLHDRYTDLDYRKHVEALMANPGLGEKRANDLLDRYSYMDILGITEDGLRTALHRWEGVPGIGKKIVAQTEQFLRADFSSPLLRATTTERAS